MKITQKQYGMLQGFYAHCYSVYHDNNKPDFSTWAELLDSVGVPWSIQNTTAIKAEDKSSISYYLSTLLGVKVEG